MKTLLALMFALLAPALVTDSFAAENKKGLSDAQIAAILIAANEVDIDAARLAESRTSNDQVKAYAERIVSEHTEANHQAKEVAKKLDMVPEENKLSNSLRSDRKRAVDRLKTLNGRQFDKAYLNDEVVFHKQVIDVVDNQLMPSASRDELKKLLIKIRPALVSHLEYAEQTQQYVDQMR
jgi:putative membrane protein